MGEVSKQSEILDNIDEHKNAIVMNLNAMAEKLDDDTEYYDAIYHLDKLCELAKNYINALEVVSGARVPDKIESEALCKLARDAMADIVDDLK